MQKIICPSMMCADFGNLPTEISDLEEAGIDIFHMDIMDGLFVPNFAMGLQDYAYVASQSQKPLDVHLMIKNPSDYIDMFADLGADIIYFHPETDLHPARTIGKIHAKGKKAGIAINPGTSIATVEELLPLVENVLVMTVNPGFAGQKYLTYVDKKIGKLSKMRQSMNFQIFVDGAISLEKIQQLSLMGVQGFILGTSSLFGKKESYADIVSKIRKM
ncbi:ribulose-phosphate 3-epimerase [Oenococcus sp.]|uniref:ribulose-phosphate 3-epimerase n=1 Tax=Oenococcus sp. TaxID=1979414 RepID=UPI0039E7D301